MLNERQLSLLEKLENQSLTMVALSRGQNVSSRTVLRDIDYLNFTLSGIACITTTTSGYQLDIFDRTRYFIQLQRHDNDDLMLFLLLTHTFITRLQLAEALNLPEKIVNDKLARLKLRYERWFAITSKPNSGHFVDEERRKKLIILANLIKKDPQLAHAEQAFVELQNQLADKTENPEFVASLLLAIYALRNQEAEPQTGNAGTFRSVYDAAGLYLSESSLKEADALVNDLRESAQNINESTISELVNKLWQEHGLGEYDQQLVNDLTAHIARCAACPVWLQESRQGSMNNLKAAWPIAFDLSISLINQIKQRLNVVIHDSDLIGLYFACALERNQGEYHTIVLLASQNAIATINQLAIERELMNCRVAIARTPAELYAMCDEITPVLVINNSHFLLETLSVETLSVKNIITPAVINLIKERVEYALIKQNLPDFIPPEFSFLHQNQAGENWLMVIGEVCAELVSRGLLGEEEAQRVYQRETEGENLVVNHLAIPHCWSESSDRFRGYFVRLAHPVIINNDTVWHMLLACTSTATRKDLKIFSYLASVLNSYDPQRITGIKDYAEFMALL